MNKTEEKKVPEVVQVRDADALVGLLKWIGEQPIQPSMAKAAAYHILRSIGKKDLDSKS